MNPLWLPLIVPVSFWFGFFMSAIFTISSRSDRSSYDSSKK